MVLRQCLRYDFVSKAKMTTSSLPRIPLPHLKPTMEKVVRLSRFMLSADEQKRTEKLTSSFYRNEGAKLQKYLQYKADTTDNWMNPIMTRLQYLFNRKPLPMCQNSGFIFKKRSFVSDEDYLRYAAKLICGTVGAIDRMKVGNIPPIRRGNLEYDKSQFVEKFNSIRVIGPKEDYTERFDPLDETRQHIIVIRNNKLFKVAIYTPDWKPYSEGALLRSLKRIMVLSTDPAVPIGILTASNRDVYSEIYLTLIQDEDNKLALREIQKSMFVVCLDGPDEDPVEKHIIHGGKNNTGNRWHDADHQIVLSRDGIYGVIGGQLITNAPASAYVIQSASEYADEHVFETTTSDTPPVTLLNIKTDDATNKAIQYCESELNKFASNYAMNCSMFDLFGKEFIKSIGVSPDAFFQTAVGLALYKIHKEPAFDYENVALHQFYKGRTEFVRTCHPETIAFCKAMLENKTGEDEKLSLLRAAVNKIKVKVIQATTGDSEYRHIQGLIYAARKLGIPTPDLFEDPGFKKLYKIRTNATEFRLAPGEACYTVTSAFPSYYGCGYYLHDDRIRLATTGWKTDERVGAVEFSSKIQESLEDLYKLVGKKETTEH